MEPITTLSGYLLSRFLHGIRIILLTTAPILFICHTAIAYNIKNKAPASEDGGDNGRGIQTLAHNDLKETNTLQNYNTYNFTALQQNYDPIPGLYIKDDFKTTSVTTSESKPNTGDEIELASIKLQSYKILEIVQQQTSASDAEMKLFCNYYYDKIFATDRSVFWKDVESKQIVTDADIKNYAEQRITEYINLLYAFRKIEQDYPNSVIEYANRPTHAAITSCNPACDNIGFENGNLSAWSAYYSVNTSSTTGFTSSTLTGGACGAVQRSAYDPNTADYQVALMSGTGVDPVAGSLIPVVCPTGGSYSCRIGDSTRNGAQMGTLQQSFVVTPANANFTYMYAVVLENPGHSYYQQPYFNVAILDSTGTPITHCGNYFVVSTSGLPGYTGIYYAPNKDTVYCKPWTTVFVPLQAYIGQCVTLRVTAADCSLGGHFGYAYFDATCSPGIISSSPAICGKNVTLTAPSGASTYQWYGSCIVGSSTQQTITVSCAGIYKVAVTSISGSGCSDTIIDTVKGSTPPAVSIISHGNVTCNGGTNGSAVASVTGGTAPYSYSWAPGGNTNTNATNLGIGSYTVTVTDANGCTDTASVIITEPVPLVITINSTIDPACYGGNNGSASLNVTGGVAPYTYIWTPSAGTSSSVTGLSAGTYTVTVADANSCSKSTTTTLSQPTPLTSSMSSVAVSCNGGNNGSANDIVSGGTAPYLYIWMPSGGSSSSASNLTAGVYTVTATDTHNCSITTSINVTQPTAITTSSSSSGAVCNGGSTGSATVTANGGTMPYTYSWAPSGGTNYTANNITAGTYTVTITDANNCKNNTVIKVTQPPALSSLTLSTDVSCHGENNGTAKVITTGGVSPYFYAWTPNVSTSDSAINLTVGAYSVVITDAHNCTTSRTINIEQPGALISSINHITNVSCNGGNNGSGSVSVTGGTLPYTYAWSPNGGTNYIAGNLSAGTYTVTTTDVNHCNVISIVTITQPPVLSLTPSSHNVSCYGGSNGSAAVKASGGTGSYTYSWKPNANIYDSASNLQSGTYTVYVTDSNKCTASSIINITQPTALSTKLVSSVNISCNGGNNGDIIVSANGGTPIYSYTWIPKVSSTSTANNLTAGSYTVTVTDANGCTSQLLTSLSQPQPITATSVVQKPTCNGLLNGSAAISTYGGVPNYTYVWNTSPPQYSSTANNLGAGVYTVLITDKNGCTRKDTVTVTQPYVLMASIVNAVNPVCYGYNNGSASVYVTGGTLPYSYSWNTTPKQNGYIASSLSAGTYSVNIYDANNCPVSASVTISQPAPVITQANAPDSVCSGTTVTITASGNGGNGIYSYAWSSGSGSIATQNVTPINSTTYTVTAIDGNGCKGNPASVTINTWNLGPANVSVTPPQVICYGDSVILYANVTNSNAGTVNIQWSNGFNGSGPYRLLLLNDTTFTINVSNQCGSTVNKNIPVKVNPLPVINIPVKTAASCSGVTLTYHDSLAANANDSYIWDFGDGTTGNTNPISHAYTQSGIYTVSVVITSPAGCKSNSVAPAKVTIYPTAKAQFNAEPKVAPITEPVIEFKNASTNTTDWVWDFGDNSAHSVEWSPKHAYSDTGSYNVHLFTNNAFGCGDTAVEVVHILPEFTFYVPNAFSPNGDGLNETFTGKGIGIIEYDMVIYDRWGMFLFETHDLYKGWDGTVNGGHRIAQEDTYVYEIRLTDIFKKKHSYIGSVTLLK